MTQRTLEKLIRLAKPVIIIMVSLVGFFASDQLVPKTCFFIIVILSFIFRGQSIYNGFVAIGMEVKKLIPQE